MRKDIWVCLVHQVGKPSAISFDGYSSLSKAQENLVMRISGYGSWLDEFNYVSKDGSKHYELKCITLED